MDDLKVGLVIRAVRLRRGWRQSDVAAGAGLSQGLVSLVERGALDRLTLRSIRRVAEVLGIRLPFEPRWQGTDLAKLLDERHASLVLAVCRRLTAAGWIVTPERTYSYFGERGSVDVIAWHAGRRAFLVVEVKTEIVDLQDLFAAFDRKRRLAPTIARDAGWKPLVYGAVIVFPDESSLRRSIDRFRPLFDHSYPARGLRIRRWIGQPDRDLRGLWFLPCSNGVAGKKRKCGNRRVRKTLDGPTSSQSCGETCRATSLAPVSMPVPASNPPSSNPIAG